MGFWVRIEPEGNEDNEYATPSYFHFKDEDEQDFIRFMRLAFKYGDKIEVSIRESE